MILTIKQQPHRVKSMNVLTTFICHKEFHANLQNIENLNLKKEEVNLDTYE